MKRVIATATIVVGLVLGAEAAAGATTLVAGTPLEDVGRRDAWACVAVEHIGVGVCQGNPLAN